MRDAITALETALDSLEHARGELPDDLRTKLDAIITQARSVLGAIAARSPASESESGRQLG